MKSFRGKISGLHFKVRREATIWLTSCLTPQRTKRSHARAVGMGYHRPEFHACEVTSDGDVFGTVLKWQRLLPPLLKKSRERTLIYQVLRPKPKANSDILRLEFDPKTPNHKRFQQQLGFPVSEARLPLSFSSQS